MTKKRNQQRSENKPKEDGTLQIADSLGADILYKLKQAKQELSQAEAKAIEVRKDQEIKEKKEREANKSFAELLNEYDGKTQK